MMKAQLLLLCIAVFPAIYAWPFKQCPEIPENALKELSYKQIEGDWNVVGSKPSLSEKCMNVTIHDYELTKNYYSKVMFFWNKKSSSSYTILNEIKPTALNLKAKSWYSFEKEKLNLIGANYGSYALFYSCSPGLFKYTESYQLWTHGEVDLSNVKSVVAERLALFNLKPEDLTYRTVKDCSH